MKYRDFELDKNGCSPRFLKKCSEIGQKLRAMISLEKGGHKADQQLASIFLLLFILFYEREWSSNRANAYFILFKVSKRKGIFF